MNFLADNSEWFSLDQNENSVKVILNSTVPLDVLENKQQLVIVVTAQAPGTATARATVIVHLSDCMFKCFLVSQKPKSIYSEFDKISISILVK